MVFKRNYLPGQVLQLPSRAKESSWAGLRRETPSGRHFLSKRAAPGLRPGSWAGAPAPLQAGSPRTKSPPNAGRPLCWWRSEGTSREFVTRFSTLRTCQAPARLLRDQSELPFQGGDFPGGDTVRNEGPSPQTGHLCHVMEKPLGCTGVISEDRRPAPMAHGRHRGPRAAHCQKLTAPFKLVLQQMLTEEVSSQEGCVQKVGELLRAHSGPGRCACRRAGPGHHCLWPARGQNGKPCN